MFKKSLRGVLPVLLALSAPLFVNAQMAASQLTAVVNDHDDAPVSISMTAEKSASMMVVGAKNLREISIQDTDGREIFTWKAEKKYRYNQVKIDVSQLPYQTYVISARYGTQRYSKVLRLSDGALWL